MPVPLPEQRLIPLIQHHGGTSCSPGRRAGQGKAGSNAEQGAARWLGKWALQWRLKAAAGPWQGKFKVYSRAHPPALEMMLLWVSTAPLGTPVVPLV